MSHRTGMLCTALFAVVGCSTGSSLQSWVGASGKQRLVSGSVDQAASNLQASLRKIDILVTVNPQGDGVVTLNGETKSRKRFALLLKRHPTSRGESTAVTIEWQTDADEQFWMTVLDLLAQPAPIAP